MLLPLDHLFPSASLFFFLADLVNLFDICLLWVSTYSTKLHRVITASVLLAVLFPVHKTMLGTEGC